MTDEWQLTDEEGKPLHDDAATPPITSHRRWEDLHVQHFVSSLNSRISDLEELVDSTVKGMARRRAAMEVLEARITELEEFIAELEEA